MDRTTDVQKNSADASGSQNSGPSQSRFADQEESAADLAKHLLEERASRCCSCDLASKGSARGRGGRDAAENTGRGRRDHKEELLTGGDDTGGRGRTGAGLDENRDDCSAESGETPDEKLPYHVHIVEHCPNGDPVVTFVPEDNGKSHFIRLPVVVSKYCGHDRYRAQKPGRCVAKAVVALGTLLLVGVVCFLAGYFTVDLPKEESTSFYRKGPVRIEVESSLRQYYLTSYSDRTSRKYRDFSSNFTKAIDAVFVSSALHDEYSHCTVNGLRRGSVIVEFTIQLHGPPTSRDAKDSTAGDIRVTTKEAVEGILRDAATSGQLAPLNVDSQSIRVTRVVFGSPQGITETPPTLWPEWATVLKTEPGLINQHGCGTRPGERTLQARILGGTDAEPGRWPWLGSIQYRFGAELEHRCAASLLNPEWAITAAHCVDGGAGEILDRIVFGDQDLLGSLPSRQKVSVERIIVHPGFSSTSWNDNDLALLRLRPPVRLDQYAVPACLETEPYETLRYQECYIAGWGNTEEYGNISMVLREAEIPLVSKEVCSQQFRDHVFPAFSIITDNMICAGRATGGVDSCQNDSGGPLTCRGDDGTWRVVGLTSFGYGCGRPNYSGVYTRVSRYWDYISSVVRGEPTVKCQELTEPTCRNRLPYTKVFTSSQRDLTRFLMLLPNTSGLVQANQSVRVGSSSRELRETLVCLTVFPSCNESGEPPVVPCREFCQGTINANFAVSVNCEKYPVGATSDAMYCRKGSNADCGPTHLYPSTSNHSVVNSPYVPGGSPWMSEPSVDCTWRVTAPPGTAVVFKFTVFKFPLSGQGKVITIGEGADVGNRTSSLYKLYGPTAPGPLVVESSEAWLAFASVSDLLDEPSEESYFSLEIHVADNPEQGFPDDVCLSGLGNCTVNVLCFPAWWRCDGLTDCVRGEDEANCPTVTPTINTTDTTATVP